MSPITSSHPSPTTIGCKTAGPEKRYARHRFFTRRLFHEDQKQKQVKRKSSSSSCRPSTSKITGRWTFPGVVLRPSPTSLVLRPRVNRHHFQNAALLIFGYVCTCVYMCVCMSGCDRVAHTSPFGSRRALCCRRGSPPLGGSGDGWGEDLRINRVRAVCKHEAGRERGSERERERETVLLLSAAPRRGKNLLSFHPPFKGRPRTYARHARSASFPRLPFSWRLPDAGLIVNG